MTSEQLAAGFPGFIFSFPREDMHRALFKCATLYMQAHPEEAQTSKGKKKKGNKDYQE